MNLQNLSSISFNGPLIGVGTDCGYGYAAVELIKGWNALGIPVWWSKEDAPIAFSFGQPEWYDWQNEDQYKIGYTPWESTKLPYGWADKMNQMDEIWTTSMACKDWFVAGGVYKKIRVLHHGLNPEHFPLKKRAISLGEPFRFLHIGEPAPRKGGQMVLEAFNDLFAGRGDVSLTLKGAPRPELDKFLNASNVTVIPERLTQEELTKLYLDHHAFVYPTNGEGFGLLPFQAAATGMPTAVTDWSGPEDYMQYCYPITVEKMIIPDYEPHEGMWAEPNYTSLTYWMESFVDSPNYFFSNAYRKAHYFSNKWSWEKISKLSASWMNLALEQR